MWHKAYIDQDPENLLVRRWALEPEQDLLWERTRNLRELRHVESQIIMKNQSLPYEDVNTALRDDIVGVRAPRQADKSRSPSQEIIVRRKRSPSENPNSESLSFNDDISINFLFRDTTPSAF
ncbi:hypothetical protein ONS96_001542 [Cadophora gregata f. sp. sojae]|nr:hypothetical protein ONS96_001542 [Cadophora gregata f. sp. sojae]